MRWFGWFRGAAYGGGSLTNPDTGNQDSRPTPGRNASNVVVTDERAMMISTVFACTRLIAQTCSTLPLGFYQKTDSGRAELPDEHYLRTLLQYTPNNFMTALEFRQAMITSRVLWGNAYAKIRRTGDRPVSLIPLKPEYMTVERTTSGLIYKYQTDTGEKEYSQRDIFHIKGFSTDGITGMSALGYARETLGLSVTADESASKSIGGHASAVLELDDMPTDAQKAKLREMYGAGKVTTAYQSDGGLMIVPGGMKYRLTDLPPDDMQLLESRSFQVAEIARFFGVPSVMIDGSNSSAAWPASYEQQMQAFLTFTLSPYLKEFESKVTASLVIPREQKTTYIEHKVQSLLRADSAGRAEFYSKALQNGWMTSNEARSLENMPKSDDPGADELRAQVNMAPLGELNNVGKGNEKQN